MIRAWRAQINLSVLWIISAVVLAVVLFLQMQLGDFYTASQSDRVWSWLTEAVLPTTTLMLGAAGGAAATRDRREISAKLYRLALLTSAVYLAAVLVVTASIGLRYSMRPLELSTGPLEYLYALTNLLIGVFFVGTQAEG